MTEIFARKILKKINSAQKIFNINCLIKLFVKANKDNL